MKKMILILILSLFFMSAMAQSNIKKNKDGNYYAIMDSSNKQPKKLVPYIINGKWVTYTDKKDVIYKLFIGSRGGVYYINKNKKKTYIKI